MKDTFDIAVLPGDGRMSHVVAEKRILTYRLLSPES